MPHITVQMYPGRSDELKKKLAEALVKTAAEVLQREPEHFSASVQDVPQDEWKERVYKDAVDPSNKEVFVRPGY
ncbi:MAG: tautomerase family protein [Treponema sp.]|nr:tautomerase family protein [Treponema sp.]